MKIILSESQLQLLWEELTLNEPLLFHQTSPNHFIFPKGTIFCWLYSDPDAGQKINNGEYSFIMFPMTGPVFGGQDLLSKLWTKSHMKKFKGSEFLMGIIQGYYNEDEKKLYIEMMTVNPKLRRQGINSHMIRFLRNKFGLSQDDIIFDKPTEMGKKFMQGKKY